jgi:hypothetical protein
MQLAAGRSLANNDVFSWVSGKTHFTRNRLRYTVSLASVPN